MRNRDYSADLIRIVATLIVIGTHVKLSYWRDEQIVNDRLFIGCLFADGVSIFFILTGFFMFNGRNYGRIVKKCLLSIVVPAFAVSIVTQIIYPWIVSDTIRGGGGNLNVSWIRLVKAILQQNAGLLEGCFHFWYIFTYVKVILCIPLLKWICYEGKEQCICRRLILVLSLLNILTNNCKQIMEIPVNTYSLLDTAVVLAIIGYEINVYKDKIKGNIRIKVCSIILFGLMNVLRFFAQKKLYLIDENNGTYINWDSIFGVTCATILFVFLYSFNSDSWNHRIKKIVEVVSGRTFTIYLLHVIVYFKLNALGIQRNFESICSEYGKIGDIIYSIFYPTLCFAITFIVSIIIKYLGRKIKNILV